MAQASSTISGQKTFEDPITVSGTCTFTSATKKITSTGTSLSPLSVRDLITISGSASNNSTFTISEVDSNGTFVIVEEDVTSETVAANTVLTYVGFVTAKVKGDGYYSQTDGLHTVAYHVTASCTGALKMQGSLATTPTEDDYFDIDGTTFTTDQSTTINSVNFTGNFIWVRAKLTANTAGAVSKILSNN